MIADDDRPPEAAVDDEQHVDDETVPDDEQHVDDGTVPDDEQHVDDGTVPDDEQHVDDETVPDDEQHVDDETVPDDEQHVDDGTHDGTDGRGGDVASTTDAESGASAGVTVGSGTVVVDGRRIAYRHAGSGGDVLVLLHGAGIDDATLSWEHVLPELGRSHRVYALDWPGYGDSDDVGTHSVDAYRRVLEGFLDAKEIESASFAGISMGGAVALSLALDDPDRVRRLALVSSYGLGASITAGSLWYAVANVPGANQAGYAAMGSSIAAARAALSNVVYDASTLDRSFVEAVRERASTSGAGAAFAAFQRAEIDAAGRVRTNFAPELETLAVPTLFVHGQQDPLFPVSWARRGARRVPRAELVELEACGHWPTHERSERTTTALGEFFAPE
jgi:pimeloyl-ACP methyl ester carboxylesterase